MRSLSVLLFNQSVWQKLHSSTKKKFTKKNVILILMASNGYLKDILKNQTEFSLNSFKFKTFCWEYISRRSPFSQRKSPSAQVIFISNKTLRSYTYIHFYVSYSWTNGWTKLADIFCKETQGYTGVNIG